MKLPWLALLSLGTAALCQAPTQRPIDPDTLFQMPDSFMQHAPPRLNNLLPKPFLWNKSIQPRRAARPKLDNHQIDPKIILHPPWRSQSKGKDFARHLYPDLKFMPLQRGPRRTP